MPALARLSFFRPPAQLDDFAAFYDRHTGKGLAAHWLHEWSPRKGALFVVVSCGAIPDGLVESELFGHAKGVFTGAVHLKMGKVEMAQGGTLFLDEIGDLPLSAQAKRRDPGRGPGQPGGDGAPNPWPQQAPWAPWEWLRLGAAVLEEMERRHIQAVLEQAGWVLERPAGAATLLGLAPSTLRSRMRKLGIRRG